VAGLSVGWLILSSGTINIAYVGSLPMLRRAWIVEKPVPSSNPYHVHF
jgi:hypothetical protein